MKVKNLLASVILLFFCCTMPVFAEGEQNSVESNVENETEKSIDILNDITINFTKGTVYKYRGEAIEPEVSGISFTDENGVLQNKKEGFEIIYKEDSNNIEIGKADAWISIEGYEGEKKIEDVFSIILGKVTSLKATAVNYKKLTVDWGKVTGAHGYKIYRSTEKGVRGKVIKTITSGNTSIYHDKTVKVGTTYYYTIKAYRKLDSGYVYSSDSKQILRKARLKEIEGVSAKRKSYNTIALKWKKNSKADGYRIYRSDSLDGTYVRIATLRGKDKLEYIDKVPVCGKKYYYKIAAYITVKDIKYRGKYSDTVSLNTRPAKVQFTNKSVSKAESVTLRWKKSSGAKGYVIYRSTKKNGNYSLIKTIKNAATLKWTNTKLDDETVFYYKIRPYTVVNGKKVYGLYSNIYEKILIPKEIEEITEYSYVNYVSGGSSPKGWDCSGFTQWVYKNIYGISIPRSSREQAQIGKSVNKYDTSKWKPGDILVYASGGSVNHVGLYLGNGKMMHALNSKYDTVIQDVDYYESWDSKNNLKSVRRCL